MHPAAGGIFFASPKQNPTKIPHEVIVTAAFRARDDIPASDGAGMNEQGKNPYQ